MKRISVVVLRQELADILNRAEYLGERIVIHRRDKDAAAIISIEELQLLDRLIQEEEDRIDIAAAQAAREENDYIPYEQFRAGTGIKDEPGEQRVPSRDRRSRTPATRKAGKGGTREDR